MTRHHAVPGQCGTGFAPSSNLSILAKAPKTLEGRKIRVPVTDGFDGALLKEFRSHAKAEKATLTVIAPKGAGPPTPRAGRSKRICRFPPLRLSPLF